MTHAPQKKIKVNEVGNESVEIQTHVFILNFAEFLNTWILTVPFSFETMPNPASLVAAYATANSSRDLKKCVVMGHHMVRNAWLFEYVAHCFDVHIHVLNVEQKIIMFSTILTVAR